MIQKLVFDAENVIYLFLIIATTTDIKSGSNANFPISSSVKNVRYIRCLVIWPFPKAIMDQVILK